MSIILEGLVKRYRAQPVVDHVSLEIEDGELFVLLGASGSGKSTILRIIAGLLPVDAGRVSLHGRDVTHLPPQQRHVGLVFQNYSLFRHMTVADNIEFGLAIRRVPRAQRAARRDELLEMVGLAGLGRRYPRQLSGGQQQRVAVARALAFEPSVLLLDEPFGALDVKIRAQLRQTLKTVQRQLGVTTILVTHDQEEAFELADRIGVIERGRLLEVGTPDALYRRPQHESVAQFLGSATLLAGRWDGATVRVGPLRLLAPAEPAHAPAERAAVLLRPEDLTLARAHDEVEGVPLGRGVVEALHFLGTLQRVQVRLEPLPGVRSLLADYGAGEVVLQVARLTPANDAADFEVGQQVWVGIRAYHLMPRTPPHLLFCLDGAIEQPALAALAATLRQVTEGPLTALLVADHPDRLAALEDQVRATLAGAVPTLVIKSRRGSATEEFLREMQAGSYEAAVIQAGEATATAVARRAPLPVLFLKGASGPMQRLLLCTAGGEPGKLDVLYGARLGRRLGARATLLHVRPASPEPLLVGPPLAVGEGASPLLTLPPSAIGRHLEQGLQTLHHQGIQANVQVRQGNVRDEILAEAREGKHDLIVVGGHLPTGSLPFLEEDLASEIVRLADRPVLVVREAHHQGKSNHWWVGETRYSAA